VPSVPLPGGVETPERHECHLAGPDPRPWSEPRRESFHPTTVGLPGQTSHVQRALARRAISSKAERAPAATGGISIAVSNSSGSRAVVNSPR